MILWLYIDIRKLSSKFKASLQETDRLSSVNLLYFWRNKGREPNSAAALASQPAAGHSLSFIYGYCFMTLGWGLLVGPAAESCSRIWLPRLKWIFL